MCLPFCPSAINFYHFVQLLLVSFCGKTLHIAHVSSPSNGIAQKNYFSRVTLLRQFVGSGWRFAAKTLHRTALSLVYSTAEYFLAVYRVLAFILVS